MNYISIKMQTDLVPFVRVNINLQTRKIYKAMCSSFVICFKTLCCIIVRQVGKVGKQGEENIKKKKIMI